MTRDHNENRSTKVKKQPDNKNRNRLTTRSNPRRPKKCYDTVKFRLRKRCLGIHTPRVNYSVGQIFM